MTSMYQCRPWKYVYPEHTSLPQLNSNVLRTVAVQNRCSLVNCHIAYKHPNTETQENSQYHSNHGQPTNQDATNKGFISNLFQTVPVLVGTSRTDRHQCHSRGESSPSMFLHYAARDLCKIESNQKMICRLRHGDSVCLQEGNTAQC